MTEDLCQRGDGDTRPTKRKRLPAVEREPIPSIELLEFGQGMILYPPLSVSRPLQGLIVYHHDVPIPAGVDVELGVGDADIHSPAKRDQRIFRHLPTCSTVGKKSGFRPSKERCHILLFSGD